MDVALGSAEFGDRCSSLVFVVNFEVCWRVFVCRSAASWCGETQEEHVSQVAHGIHEFAEVE